MLSRYVKHLTLLISLTLYKYTADESPLAVPMGSNDIIQRLIAQDKACPDQRFALVGFDLVCVLAKEISHPS